MNMRLIFNRFDTKNMQLALLVLLWCVAIVAGISIAVYTEAATTSLLHNVISSRVSFISLILTSGCSLLLTGIALNRASILPIYFLIITTGTAKGFVGMLAYLACGSGAWLLRFMLLFTSSNTMLLVWWLVLTHHKQIQKSLYRDYVFAAFFASVVSVLDAFMISPIISGLSI